MQRASRLYLRTTPTHPRSDKHLRLASVGALGIGIDQGFARCRACHPRYARSRTRPTQTWSASPKDSVDSSLPPLANTMVEKSAVQSFPGHKGRSASVIFETCGPLRAIATKSPPQARVYSGRSCRMEARSAAAIGCQCARSRGCHLRAFASSP